MSLIENEVKKTPSYLVMVIKAILSSSDKTLLLQEIYLYIKEHYPEIINKHVSWQNSVRHNLSTHGCFYKARKYFGQGASYWGIHSVYIPYLEKGDFTRRWPLGPRKPKKGIECSYISIPGHMGMPEGQPMMNLLPAYPQPPMNIMKFDQPRAPDLLTVGEVGNSFYLPMVKEPLLVQPCVQPQPQSQNQQLIKYAFYNQMYGRLPFYGNSNNQ